MGDPNLNPDDPRSWEEWIESAPNLGERMKREKLRDYHQHIEPKPKKVVRISPEAAEYLANWLRLLARDIEALEEETEGAYQPFSSTTRREEALRWAKLVEPQPML